MNKPSEQYTNFDKAIALSMAIEELIELYHGAKELGKSQEWLDQIDYNVNVLISMKEELDD